MKSCLSANPQRGRTLRQHAHPAPMSTATAEPPTSAPLDLRAIAGTWSVAHVKAREERAVERAVRDAGLATFLPLRKQWQIYRNGRRDVVERPIFEEYLFVAWTHPDQRGHVLGAKGVHQLLPVSRQQQLRDELEQVQRVLITDPFLDVDQWIRQGVKARVTSGPFEGINGEVHERRGKRVFLAGVKMLGQALVLEVEDWQIEPL